MRRVAASYLFPFYVCRSARVREPLCGPLTLAERQTKQEKKNGVALAPQEPANTLGILDPCLRRDDGAKGLFLAKRKNFVFPPQAKRPPTPCYGTPNSRDSARQIA